MKRSRREKAGDIETRMLPVKLAPDELLIRSTELSEAIDDKVTLERGLKEETGRTKLRIAEIDHRILDLAKVIRNKEEDRAVEVRERRNYTKDIVDVYRVDTGEIVDYRDLTDLERQDTYADSRTH